MPTHNVLIISLFLLSIIFIQIPLSIAGLVIGRHTRKNPLAAYLLLARESDTSKLWSILGILNIFTAAMITVLLGIGIFSACLATTSAPLQVQALDNLSVIQFMNIMLMPINLGVSLTALYGIFLPDNASLSKRSLLVPVFTLPILACFLLLTPYTLQQPAFATLQTGIHYLLPANSLLTAIFVGWVMKRKIAKKELADLGYTGFNIWYAFLRVFAPVSLIAVIVLNIAN